MAKTGVLSVSANLLRRRIPLRKFYLLFNKLYLDQSTFTNAIAELCGKYIMTPVLSDLEAATSLIEFQKFLNSDEIMNNLKSLGYLKQIGFLDMQVPTMSEKTSHLFDDFISSGEGTLDDITDRFARMISLIKQIDNQEDTYPLLICPPKGNEQSKKKSVVKFLLSEVPEPDESVSWEQLRDFKSDPDTMTKYYALIKWINDIAQKDFSLNQIEEEYRYLYHDYANQYSIHKMKSNRGIIEVLVTVATDFLTGQMGIGNMCTTLFSIEKHHYNFLEAETKFTGREVAYMYKIEQRFK